MDTPNLYADLVGRAEDVLPSRQMYNRNDRNGFSVSMDLGKAAALDEHMRELVVTGVMGGSELLSLKVLVDAQVKCLIKRSQRLLRECTASGDTDHEKLSESHDVQALVHTLSIIQGLLEGILTYGITEE